MFLCLRGNLFFWQNFHYLTMSILKEQAVNGHHNGVILPFWTWKIRKIIFFENLGSNFVKIYWPNLLASFAGRLASSASRLASSAWRIKPVHHRTGSPYILVKSALWAKAFYNLKCTCVYPFVCLFVRLFTFEVPFKRLFVPTSWSRTSKVFLRIRNPWGKIIERSGLRFENFY